MRYLRLYTLAITLFTSCGHNDATSGASRVQAALQTTPDRLGLTDLGAALARASCRSLFACCTGAELNATLHDAVADVTDCERELGTRYRAYVRAITTAVGQDRVAYHGDRAKACVASLAAQTCAAYARVHALGPEPGSACDTWLEPKGDQGAACAEDNQCLSAYCEGRQLSADGTLVDGACAPLPAVGSACDGRCAAGAFCDAGRARLSCVPALPDGAACSEGVQCRSGVCDPIGSAGGTCRAAPQACSGPDRTP